MNNTAICECGTPLEKSIGNVKYKVKDKEIIIINVPHYLCDSCGEVSHERSSGIRDLLTVAVKNDYNTILWT